MSEFLFPQGILPTRAQIRESAESFQRAIAEGIAAGKNAHQLALDRQDLQTAFAETLSEPDQERYFTIVTEETNALVAAAKLKLAETNVQLAQNQKKIAEQELENASKNAVAGQVGATVGGLILFFVVFQILKEMMK